MKLVKTLIHVHTDYSYDSSISLETLANFMEREDFGCVAVTDHDTIDGALMLRSRTTARVIVGEEVSTRDGHVIGLFLEEEIRPGMSARDTAAAIRDQGGLVFLPHPFVRMFGCGLGELAWELADLFDAVEVNNAQNLRAAPERRAHGFAERTGLIKYAGSDAHLPSSIAPCYQLLRDFDGPADFIDALRTAELREGRHPLRYFAEIGRQIIRSMARLPRTIRPAPAPQPEYARASYARSVPGGLEEMRATQR